MLQANLAEAMHKQRETSRLLNQANETADAADGRIRELKKEVGLRGLNNSSIYIKPLYLQIGAKDSQITQLNERVDRLKTQLKNSHDDLEGFKRQFTPSRLDEIEELAREEEKGKRRRIISDMDRRWKDDIEGYMAQLRGKDATEAELRRENNALKIQLSRKHRQEPGREAGMPTSIGECNGCGKEHDIKEMFICTTEACLRAALESRPSSANSSDPVKGWICGCCAIRSHRQHVDSIRPHEDFASDAHVQSVAKCIQHWKEEIRGMFSRQQPEIRAYLAAVGGDGGMHSQMTKEWTDYRPRTRGLGL